MSRNSSARSNISSRSKVSSAKINTNKNNFKVIIIGAGISGLSACNYLLDNGINDIVILEANDRIGGRINTIPFENGFIELGAQWIHGTEGNPVYEISKSIGNIDPTETSNDTTLYASQDGKTLDEKIIEKIIDRIHEAMERISDEIKEDDLDKSLGSLMNQELKNIIQEYEGEIDAELIKAIFVSETSNERYESSCDDLDNLSALAWNLSENLDGDLFTKQKHGYIKVLEYLRSKLPNNMIKLNELVSEINWSDLDNIIIKTENGTIYETKKILCTISLGYLKANHRSLFKPNLPTKKINSIENLGFGCVDKFWLIFEESLSNLDIAGLQIFYRNDIDFNIDNLVKKWNLKNKDFYKELTGLEILPNHDNILFGFAAGSNAIFIEDLEDECLIDLFNELLSKIFPDVKFPRLKSIMRSKWHNDKIAKGSYTYIKAGTYPNMSDDLAEPLENSLFFAGEATILSYIGTVHGAFISGQNAAKSIIDSL